MIWEWLSFGRRISTGDSDKLTVSDTTYVCGTTVKKRGYSARAGKRHNTVDIREPKGRLRVFRHPVFESVRQSERKRETEEEREREKEREKASASA